MKKKEELKMAPVLPAWKRRRLLLLDARTWEETGWQEGQDVTFFVVRHEKQGLWVRQIGSFHLSVSLGKVLSVLSGRFRQTHMRTCCLVLGQERQLGKGEHPAPCCSPGT